MIVVGLESDSWNAILGAVSRVTLQDGGGSRKYTEYLLDLPPY
jgi:hypothetical protein